MYTLTETLRKQSKHEARIANVKAKILSKPS